ncbi:MAG: hypothetical protein OEZ59_05425, partial [Deltaproteobacteria bacterium]|nr:hypothetical protein [Deltaproteobacteria bacterium]
MIRWLQKTVALRWVILPLVFGITVYMAYLSASRLTDDSGTLIFDTSLDNYLSKGRDSYRFFLQVTEMFGDDQFILMATQPPAGSGPDAEFFLELDAMSADIRRQVPGVKEVLSVINTPQFLTSCVGDSHFYFEAPGSVCVSLLEQLQAAHKCWDEHPQGLAAPTGSAAAGPAADDPDGPVFFSGGEDGSREEAPQAASASDTPPPTDGNEEEPVFFPGGKSTAPDPAPASTGMEKTVAGNP